MLSPILRRLCVSSKASSNSSIDESPIGFKNNETTEISRDNETEEVSRELMSELKEEEQIGANPQHPDAAAALQEVAEEPEINRVDSSSEEITTVLQHQQQEILRPLNSSRSIKQRPKTFHQQSLTKDEARKRMLSWRKTTQPRVRKPCNRSTSEDQG